MARDSRPPGFDMSFRPAEAMSFGAPLKERVPSYVYLGLTVLFVGFIAYGHVAPAGSLAHHYVVEASRSRSAPAATFASLVLLSGVAAVLRAHMRGVRVLPDGIETTDVLLLGVPRVRRIDWPMIDRFRFDAVKSVGVDLWNGTQEFFPEVGDRAAMVEALRTVAEARAIPYVADPREPLASARGGRSPTPGARSLLLCLLTIVFIINITAWR